MTGRTLAEIWQLCERFEAAVGPAEYARLLESDSDFGGVPTLTPRKRALLAKLKDVTGISISTREEMTAFRETALRKGMPTEPFDPTDPATIERLETCARLEAVVGEYTYVRLLCSQKTTREIGRLLFWQEAAFRRFAEATGILISAPEQALRVLGTAIAKANSEPSPPPIKRPGRSIQYRPPVPRSCPKGHHPEEWAAQEKELRDYHLQSALADDLRIRQAKAWNDEAVRLTELSKTARSEGDEKLADDRMREAFDLARKAAEHCQTVYEAEPISSYQGMAAQLALECGEFQEAMRLSRRIGCVSFTETEEFLKKWRAEAELQRRNIGERAEAIRQRLVADPLGERTIAGIYSAFSPDSRFMACTHLEKAWILELDTDRRVSEFELAPPKEPLDSVCGQRQVISDLCYSPDGKSIAFASYNNTISIWDCVASLPRHVLPGHRHLVFRVAFAPNGQRIASGGCFGMKLWDPAKGKNRGTFAANVYCESIAFSPDSGRVAFGRGESGRLTVLDIESKTEVYSVKAGTDIVRDVAFSPCGHFLAAANSDCRVRVLEAASGREIVTLVAGDPTILGGGSSVAFSPDGTLLATAGGGHVLVWNLPSYTCSIAIPDTGPVSKVRFSPDGKILAANSNVVRLWDVAHLLSLRIPLNELPGKIGKTIVPVNPQTALEQSVPTAPASRKMPAPRHLAAITAPIKSKCSSARFAGNVVCPCGAKSFTLSHAGDTWKNEQGEKFPKDTKVGDSYFMVIEAACAACRTAHLLFDKAQHGWNGYVVDAENTPPPRPELVAWKCFSCEGLDHTATISVMSEGRATAIEESGDFLDASNWQEGFGSIQIATKCCHCGHKAPEWLMYEAM